MKQGNKAYTATSSIHDPPGLAWVYRGIGIWRGVTADSRDACRTQSGIIDSGIANINVHVPSVLLVRVLTQLHAAATCEEIPRVSNANLASSNTESISSEEKTHAI
jgi:hypothetical protein